MIPSVSQDGGLPRIATGSASTSPCFGACTAFTCVAACLLAEPPEAARCLEGFDGFVTSAAAPIATGWSDQLSGQELHLLKVRAFSRRTATATPIGSSDPPPARGPWARPGDFPRNGARPGHSPPGSPPTRTHDPSLSVTVHRQRGRSIEKN